MAEPRAGLRGPSRLVAGAAAVGAACLALALVPTATYADAFAHPVRVELLAGAIPEATMQGAAAFRFALAAAAAVIPLLVWMLVRACPPDAERPPRPIAPRTRAGWLLLAGIVAIGGALRIAVARESLWYDEISAFLSFAIEGPGVAFGSYAVPTNHVPMTIATWAAWTLSGGSLDELVLRAPAIAAGVASIAVAYALGATLFSRRLGLFTALAVAVGPIPVVEGAEARGYAFVILGALVATLALARAFRTRSAREYAVFAGACAFMAWSHPVAVLVPVSAGVIGLARDRRLAIASLCAGVVAAVLLAPLVGDVLATRADYARSDAAQPAPWSREGFEALYGLALAWTGGLKSWWCLEPTSLLAVAAGFGYAAIAMSRAPTARRTRAAIAPLLAAFALAFVLSATLGTWIYARFLVFTVPAGALALTAFAWSSIRASRRVYPIPRKPPVFMIGPRAALCALALVLAARSGVSNLACRQPIRDAVEVVARSRAADDRVSTIGLPDNAVGFYAQRYGFEATATGFLGKDLAAVLARDAPRFVVVLYPSRVDGEILRMLDDGFDRTHAFDGWADWGAGAVEIWERAR
ncbi:MAG: glycosyltransferase family 39 protein [Planctomycetota bacterium]